MLFRLLIFQHVIDHLPNSNHLNKGACFDSDKLVLPRDAYWTTSMATSTVSNWHVRFPDVDGECSAPFRLTEGPHNSHKLLNQRQYYLLCRRYLHIRLSKTAIYVKSFVNVQFEATNSRV
jgi:hypothetical protein